MVSQSLRAGAILQSRWDGRTFKLEVIRQGTIKQAVEDSKEHDDIPWLQALPGREFSFLFSHGCFVELHKTLLEASDKTM